MGHPVSLVLKGSRSTQPTGKAGGREKSLKLSSRKTRVIRPRLNCLKSNPGWL
jgi:hypothetical protein